MPDVLASWLSCSMNVDATLLRFTVIRESRPPSGATFPEGLPGIPNGITGVNEAKAVPGACAKEAGEPKANAMKMSELVALRTAFVSL